MIGWTLERWLLIATFSCSAVAVVFGLGVQWNETAQVKARIASLNAQMSDYVRADVYASDQRRLSEAIDRLTKVLDDASEPPIRTGRRFDK